jgi:non-heme chloroperoxidase
VLQSVSVGKINLAYEEKGSSGSAVLMVHGIPTDYRVWNAQQTDLSPFFRTIAISRRHAYPNENGNKLLESTVENNSQDLIEFIQKLKLQPLHLIGHSFGGFVSLYSAWKRPELFRTLTLIEPAIPSILVKNEKNPLQILVFLITNFSAATSARKFQTGMLKLALATFDKGDHAAAVKYFYDGIREAAGSFDKLANPLHDIMLENGLTVGELETEFPVLAKADARSITIPALLVKGEKSPQWLRGIVDGLAKSLPNNKMIQISGSGHLSHVENPSELNPQILEFLKKNDRP